MELTDAMVAGPGGLLARFTTIPDPRSRHGRRHRLAPVLTIAAAAVLAGARSLAAVGQFSQTLGQPTLARLGTWQRPFSDWHVAPSETTFRALLGRLDADRLDRVLGQWLAGLPGVAGSDAVAVDAKTLRGARTDRGQVVVFGALAHGSGVVLAQRQVPHATTETTQLAGLLDAIPELAGKIVTADAAHTNAAAAAGLRERGAEYLLTVKGNQPGLLAAIDRLPPNAFSPCAHDG